MKKFLIAVAVFVMMPLVVLAGMLYVVFIFVGYIMNILSYGMDFYIEWVQSFVHSQMKK